MAYLLASLLVFLIFAFNFFVLLTRRNAKQCASKASSSKLRLPPGPRGLPIVGNLFQIGSDPHIKFAELNRKYGPIVFLRLGCCPTVIIDSPHIAKEILKTQDHIFASRPPSIASEYFSYNYEDVALAPYGTVWRNARRLCLSELLTPRRVESFAGQRREEYDKMVMTIWKNCKARQVTDLQYTLGGLAMNIVTRMLVNKSFLEGELFTGLHSEGNRVVEMLHKSFRLMGAINISDYLPWLRRFDLQGYERQMKLLRKRLDIIYDQIIEDHMRARKESEVKDFVDLLLASTNGEQGDKEAPLSNTTIKGLIHDMVAAGTDTSSVTSEYVMAELLRNPEIMQRAQAEIDDKVGKERLVEESDVMDFHYLRCIVKETLRFHPPGPFLIPHYSMEETQVVGYHIPKGTTVIVSVFGLGRNPLVWDKPEIFNPDRFAAESIPEFRDPDCKLIVFGSGRRGCPGFTLGSYMVLLGVARLIHCFDWACPPGQRAEEINLGGVYGMTMPMKGHLMAVATPRLPEHVYTQLCRI